VSDIDCIVEKWRQAGALLLEAEKQAHLLAESLDQVSANLRIFRANLEEIEKWKKEKVKVG